MVVVPVVMAMLLNSARTLILACRMCHDPEVADGPLRRPGQSIIQLNYMLPFARHAKYMGGIKGDD
jgi:hypothetical protein